MHKNCSSRVNVEKLQNSNGICSSNYYCSSGTRESWGCCTSSRFYINDEARLFLPAFVFELSAGCVERKQARSQYNTRLKPSPLVGSDRRTQLSLVLQLFGPFFFNAVNSLLSVKRGSRRACVRVCVENIYAAEWSIVLDLGFFFIATLTCFIFACI